MNQNTKWYNNVPNNQMMQNYQNNNMNSSMNNQGILNSQNNSYYQTPYQGQNNNYTNNILNRKRKKKLKWWIPVLLFGIGFLTILINFTMAIMADPAAKNLVKISPILQSIISILGILSLVLVIPSIIVVIIMYHKKTPEEKMEATINMNNMINNANSLYEKLLIAYIGDSYNYIKPNKFSIPAAIFNWLFLLYRKMYIPPIVGLIVFDFLGFLPDALFIIISTVTVIVLGINFNKWYILYAKKQIEKIKLTSGNVSESEIINIVQKKGGTNFWLAIAIYVAVSVILSFI